LREAKPLACRLPRKCTRTPLPQFLPAEAAAADPQNKTAKIRVGLELEVQVHRLPTGEGAVVTASREREREREGEIDRGRIFMWKGRALPRATFRLLSSLLLLPFLLHLNVATLSGAEARDVASRRKGGGGGGEEQGMYDDDKEEEDSWEPYSPSMTSEERERAEMKDGWMIMPLPNIEFARIEPGDSCSDVGWSERPRPRRVWDAFMFFNELDVLEVRLNELNSSVHKFVLVEATKTHSGNSKPLHYADNSQRFSAFHGKIVHVVVDDLPVHSNPWVLEK
jgi:hypothetical protein